MQESVKRKHAKDAKNLEISVLLDFYGEMLTEKQREVVGFYYDEDLSLAEIAEHSGITRQGVRDSIKRAENQLLECESKLGLWQRFQEIEEKLEEIAALAKYLREECPAIAQSPELSFKAARIIDLAKGLKES